MVGLSEGRIERDGDEAHMDQQVTNNPMAFQILSRDAFTVLGVEEEFARIKRNDPGFVKIWLERFEAKHEQVQPLSIDKAYHGIFFYPPERVGKPARYLAGMTVAQIPETPADWIEREISAARYAVARYAVHETTLAQIGDATDQALVRWLLEAGYEHDYPKPHFDFMPPEATRADSPVTVWIPISHKT
jgi:predicted transcriptional regulator YdeE